MKFYLVLIGFIGLFTCSFNVTAMGGPGATSEDFLEKKISGLVPELQEVVIIKTLDSILKEQFPRKKADRNAFIRRFLEILSNRLLRRSNRKYFLNILARKLFLTFGTSLRVPAWYLIKYFGERGKEYGWKEKHALREDILDYRFSLLEILKHNQLNRKVENGTLNLSHLRLNNIDGLLKIPKITTVTKLILKNNPLKELPSEIGNLVSLQFLGLANNQLKVLPPQIGKLTALQKLDLYNNQLKALPKKIGNLVSLQILYLPRNQLKILPKQISKLKNLRILNLEGNQDLKGQEAKIRKMLPKVTVEF